MAAVSKAETQFGLGGTTWNYRVLWGLRKGHRTCQRSSRGFLLMHTAREPRSKIDVFTKTRFVVTCMFLYLLVSKLLRRAGLLREFSHACWACVAAEWFTCVTTHHFPSETRHTCNWCVLWRSVNAIGKPILAHKVSVGPKVLTHAKATVRIQTLLCLTRTRSVRRHLWQSAFYFCSARLHSVISQMGTPCLAPHLTHYS